MAMGNVMRAIYALLLGCSAVQADGYTTDMELRGTPYVLSDEAGQCVIEAGDPSARLYLNLPAPCGFVTNDGAVQVQTYPPVRSVVFVAGPRAIDAGQSACAASGQAIVIDGSEVTLGAAQLVSDWFCHNRGLDEIVFRMAAGVEN